MQFDPNRSASEKLLYLARNVNTDFSFTGQIPFLVRYLDNRIFCTYLESILSISASSKGVGLEFCEKIQPYSDIFNSSIASTKLAMDSDKRLTSFGSASSKVLVFNDLSSVPHIVL